MRSLPLDIGVIHFVGIGGIGMCGLAELLLAQGYAVTGSDLASGATVERLRRLGALIAIGHDATHLGAADVVVVSSAVRRDNAEVVAAQARGIPVIPRAEMLAEVMRLKDGIAVAGTHGKTTTTSLLAHILLEAGRDPSLFVGGVPVSFGQGWHLGRGEDFVVEGDTWDLGSDALAGAATHEP